MASDLFKTWVKVDTNAPNGVRLYVERSGARKTALKDLKKLLADHFVGETSILDLGGYKKAAKTIQNSLPVRKRTRSGDLAELIATEYVDAETTFRVPIRKLRWKSDREMPMHGNDVIAADTTRRTPLVLKGECKSRAQFSPSVVKEAVETLEAHDARPNPSTLAFITKRLSEAKRHKEAAVFRDLQTRGAIAVRNITHLVFVLSGKDPCKHLLTAPKPLKGNVSRDLVAIVVDDHQAFIADVYETYGRNP